MSLQVNKYLTSASVWGLGLGCFFFFFSSLKTLGCDHKCQELNSKLQLYSQGGISKIWKIWVLLPVCDGTPLPTHPLPPLIIPSQGKRGSCLACVRFGFGWGHRSVCSDQLFFCVVFVHLMNIYIVLVRGEMLTPA